MRLLSLLSGGIDSVTACYLLGDNAEMDYLHIAAGSGSLEKARKLVAQIEKDREWIYAIEQHILMKEIREFMIRKKVNEKYTCIYCKRGMLKTAEMLAQKIGCDAIITGDSIGQVASQTVRNLYFEETAVKIPIIRPLIGLDKEEIIDIARKAGTYEISIEQDEGCDFLPSQPITEAKKKSIIDFDFSFEPFMDHIRKVELFTG